MKKTGIILSAAGAIVFIITAIMKSANFMEYQYYSGWLGRTTALDIITPISIGVIIFGIILFVIGIAQKVDSKKNNNPNHLNQYQNTPLAQEGKIFCTACGQSLSSENTFCTRCGNKILK